ncbi:MAG: aldose epimerase family protein [Pseudomonadales bacterium]
MKLFKLANSNGVEIAIMDLGATIVSVKVPDRFGKIADVVLGFDALPDYLSDQPYFGGIVGRYANRIAYGRFSIDGKAIQLACNDGKHHLHGGTTGFNKRLWRPIPELSGDHNKRSVDLQLISEHGDQGYPGTLSCRVCYVLDDNNRLTVTYSATTTEPTVVNLSQHSYFNLAGHHAAGQLDSALEHILTINADYFTEIDDTLIPTGHLAPVKGTPLDFSQATKVGVRINENHQQLNYAEGYDHNFVLNADVVNGPEAAAKLVHLASGRTLRIYTDAPGMQFYSGNFLDGSATGKSGVAYQRRGGLAFETQYFPDSPNQPFFPSTRLNPGGEFKTQTVFEFGVVSGQ